MIKYKLTKNGVIDLETGMFIPSDPANRHWQEYQEWLKSGNNPLPEHTLEELKQRKLAQLKQELKNFIYSRYDDGTQKTLQTIYIQAQEAGDTAKINTIKQVWDWINSVLIYYYQKKDAILNAIDEASLNNITWDWSLVDETNHVELKNLL